MVCDFFTAPFVQFLTRWSKAKGTGAATFVSTCLENWVGKHDEESEDTIRGVSAAMYTGKQYKLFNGRSFTYLFPQLVQIPYVSGFLRRKLC